jgi:hypothetical protein
MGDMRAHDRVRGSLNHRLLWQPSPRTRFLGQPRAEARGRSVSAPALVSRGEWGQRCMTPRQTCPQPRGLG